MVIIKKIIEVRKKEKCVESLNFKLHLFSEFFLIDVLETFKKVFAEQYLFHQLEPLQLGDLTW